MEQYLRIDTTNVGRPSSESYGTGGLLTPLPSAIEGRRGSMASSENWSFGSYPGSVSSGDVSQGPSTPPNSESMAPMNFFHVGSEHSLQDFGFSHQHAALKTPIDNVPYEPMTPIGNPCAHQSDDWTWSSVHSVPSMTSYQAPLANDFESALRSTLPFTPHGASAHLGAPADEYQLHQPSMQACGRWQATGFFNDIVPTDDIQQHGIIPMNQLCEAFPQSAPSMVAEQRPTVDPSETFVKQDAVQTDFDTDPESDFMYEDINHSSPLPEVDFGDATLVSDPDFVPLAKRPARRSARAICETSTGGKRVHKKERRSQAGVRKRYRGVRELQAYHGGVEVKVEFDENVHRNKDGSFSSTKDQGNKQECGAILENGEVCDKAFARGEHLKRHRETHTGVREYPCPWCMRENRGKVDKKDEKKFNRNDNRQEHYKTHLRKSKAGRNTRTKPLYLLALIFEDIPKDFAEKSNGSLVKYLHSEKGREETENDIVPLLKWIKNPKSLEEPDIVFSVGGQVVRVEAEPVHRMIKGALRTFGLC